MWWSTLTSKRISMKTAVTFGLLPAFGWPVLVARNKMSGLSVYDTGCLGLGLPRVEAETRAKLDGGDLSWGERRQLTAKLKRLTRIREGLSELATSNS